MVSDGFTTPTSLFRQLGNLLNVYALRGGKRVVIAFWRGEIFSFLLESDCQLGALGH